MCFLVIWVDMTRVCTTLKWRIGFPSNNDQLARPNEPFNLFRGHGKRIPPISKSVNLTKSLLPLQVAAFFGGIEESILQAFRIIIVQI